MDYMFLFKCFFVGIAAASGIGPLFILTFNKGALHGFSRGFATAMGTSVVDGFFFSLSLVGVLAAIEDSWQFMAALDFIGGVILLFLAYRTFRSLGKDIKVIIGEKEHVVTAFTRAFLLTIVNPLTILFFMVVVTKILPINVRDLSPFLVAIGTALVTCGSLTVLGSVAFVASQVGHRISQNALTRISLFSGAVFVFFSCYLFRLLAISLYNH